MAVDANDRPRQRAGTPNEAAHVVPLAADAQASADLIGNKAASLVELLRAGFRVPAGMCVTTSAYRAWRAAGALTDELRAELLAAFGSLRAPVAVRSSSPAEDRADASFAGQYETVLGVRTDQELLQAVEKCWISASSAAAQAYRKDQHAEAEVEMAVLIQELVPASAAGVLFTMNPLTDRVDQVVVNANFGLGESVVSGHAQPDTFVLSKASGEKIEAQLGTKRVASRLGESGVVATPLEQSQQNTFSLTDEQLRELAEAARALEAHYDFPMDAEWAFEGSILHLLQARPVTTGAAAYFSDLLDQWARDRGLESDPEKIWVRYSVLSSLAVSPLYYSEMSAFFADMFPAIARLHGATPPRTKIFHYYNGFAYTDASFSSTADPSGTVQPAGPLSPEWRANWRIALRHPRSLSFWANIDYYYRKWEQEWWPGVQARRSLRDSGDPVRIRDYIEYIEAQRRERSVVAGLAVGYAPNFLNLLAWCLERWRLDDAPDTIGVLTSGLPDLFTHEENVGVWKLAQRAARSPELRDAMLQGQFDSIEGLPDGVEFLAAVDAFRGERPHRGCSDRDIYQPRWGDDREALLRQVGVMLGLGGSADPDAAHARAMNNRLARERQVLERFGRGPLGSLRRRIFLWVLRSTQRYVVHRDNQRHTFEPYFLELRRAYQAIGALLVQRGVLSRADDVFFLGKNEIYAHIDGKLAAERVRARAQWRREWWLEVSREEPPTHLLGNRPHDPGVSDESGADLQGSGGAPGVASGPVRLISSLQELNLVRPGDILVTHAIDPAWTPVFGIIGGVISVEGGMLAHAAVLGREYGLPVVVGAAGATARLQDGELVRIDGTSGRIWRVAADDKKSTESDGTDGPEAVNDQSNN